MEDKETISETALTYGEISDVVLGAMKPPRLLYKAIVALLGAGAVAGFCTWVYQVRAGMWVTGLSIPIGWGTYITNFVFWVGIGHAGTLVSAILHLVRSRWRTSVSRAAEAMTVFAVMTAALFPLVHLGRVWVFYYIVPYPSERMLWPNFISPLVWDVCAVLTYLTVSSIFWFIGLIPDLAAARDRWMQTQGPDNPRTKLYRILALGWCGSGNQWHHYGRGYLFFAALATPLVISVHSVVSWDFAMSNLAGWHSTIFAPYFVAGAIHSGLAMVLTLLIPMRHLLKLDRVIDRKHFEAVAQTMIVTTVIVGYAYAVEPFISWYSGDIFERQFAVWRATGGIAPFFWALPTLNVLVPLALLYRPARQNLVSLFIISILVNIGMWLERIVIIAGSLSHDFLPHSWHSYCPSWVEVSITIGSFCFFLFCFFGFAKLAPTVSMVDVKEDHTEGSKRYFELDTNEPHIGDVRKLENGILGVFNGPEALLTALRKARASAFNQLETYSPVRLREAEQIMGRGPSPLRLWTLTGAILGLIGGFSLAIGAALVNSLIVGGKHPVSIFPYCIIGFEGTILLGGLANLAGVLFYSKLGRGTALPSGYDLRFSRDRYGLMAVCDARRMESARSLMREAGAKEIHVIQR
jgi:molybdopterin-containing oxidoreductase family membrane subunit